MTGLLLNRDRSRGCPLSNPCQRTRDETQDNHMTFLSCPLHDRPSTERDIGRQMAVDGDAMINAAIRHRDNRLETPSVAMRGQAQNSILARRISLLTSRRAASRFAQVIIRACLFLGCPRPPMCLFVTLAPIDLSMESSSA